MPPIQTALAIAGLSKQAAKGTPDTQPDFVYGLLDGAPFQVEIDQAPEDVTLDVHLVSPAANRMSVVPGQAITTRAYPDSIGLLLYAALGSKSVTGAGPYEHIFTPGTDLPYLTAWGKLGGVLHRVQDAKLDELTISWEEAGPLQVEYSLIGTIIGWPGSITPGVDESLADYYRAAGGTFAVNTAGAAASAPIKGGSIKVSNDVAPVILSASVVPDDVAIGHKVLEVTLNLVVSDLDEWRQIVTGSDSGTTASQTAVAGQLDLTFVNGSDSLQLEATDIAFMADFPDADAGGGAAELEIVGSVLVPSSGAPLTATLTNSHAAY